LKIRLTILLLLVAALAAMPSARADEASSLAKLFDDPPASARPATWWHWMNGNVTKEGITLDLEWMRRVGLGGVAVYEVAYVALPGQAVYRSEYWQEMMRHAIKECARLGLEFGLHNCSGWNNSGGPWVEPADSMKKPVFSRSLVAGPLKCPAAPPAPPAEQILPFSGQNGMNRELERMGFERTRYDPFYKDVAIFAYPAPQGALPPMRELRPEVEPAAAGPAERLWDGDQVTGIDLKKTLSADGRQAEIVLKFPRPVTARSLSLVTGEWGIPCKEVEWAALTADGSFRIVRTFSIPKNGGPLRDLHGVSFDPVTADRFRLRFVDMKPTNNPIELRELEISGEAKIEAWPVKAGFLRGQGQQSLPNPAVVTEASQAVPTGGVIDLTGKLQSDGTLDWEVPPGEWIVLRMGVTSTGKMNHPASVGGLGLEVDKFDSAALERFFRKGSLQMVLDLAGEHAGKTFKTVEIDSWEVGAQNWTGDMPAQFQRRRGYDPFRFLPALSGQVVESAEMTERFLRDWRQTCSDLFAEHFYGGFQRFLHPHGIGVFAEPANNGNFNNLEMGGFLDHAASEFWTTPGWLANPHAFKSVASLANTHGLPRVEAEAFTSSVEHEMWRQHPRKMKALGDRALALGINHFIFHTSAHQPWVDEVPGMTMGPFGIHFTRNTSWAEQSVAWIRYITRCQAMLQAGRNSADVLIFVGEDAPINFDRQGILPQGYGYDACDPTILLQQASVENGEIVLKSGMRYRVLVLPDNASMTVPLAEKLRNLVREGATVLARQKPGRTPGLENYPESEKQLQAVIGELFGDLDGKAATERTFGKGRLLWGPSLEETLQKLKIEPAWRVDAAPSGDMISGIHRTTGREEVFFLASDRPEAHRQEISFRIAHGAPEIWHPYHQTRQRASGVRHENGRTIVTLDFEPDDAFFVVFPQKPSTEKVITAPPERPPALQALNGPWTVEFQKNRGAPAQVELGQLVDLKEHPDDNIKFFSGTATYRSTFNFAPAEAGKKASRIFLDLGQVEVVAEVRLNGKDLGILWKYPYQTDITDAVQPGSNALEVRVTNLWPNRLIGDARQFPVDNNHYWAREGKWPDWLDNPDKPNPTGRIGFVTWPYWKAEDKLLPSGLIGPVRLHSP
jgi:hypothetical protein